MPVSCLDVLLKYQYFLFLELLLYCRSVATLALITTPRCLQNIAMLVVS